MTTYSYTGQINISFSLISVYNFLEKYQYVFPKSVSFSTNPTSAQGEDFGYIKCTYYTNSTTNENFLCVSSAVGAASWYKIIDYFDPGENTVYDIQTEVDRVTDNRNVLITPQIYFQDPTIEYDITIPSNALSAGPIEVLPGKTVTINTNGSWVIT